MNQNVMLKKKAAPAAPDQTAAADENDKKTSPMWLKVLAVVISLAALAAIGITAHLYKQYLDGTREMNALRQSVVVSDDSVPESPTESPTAVSETPTPTAEVPVSASSAEETPDSDMASASVEVEDEPAEPPLPICQQAIDFDSAHQTNEDIYAWITVPGTSVDHPILQSVIDDYYLKRNLDCSDGYPGCLYTNRSCNNHEFTDSITVVYGHNVPTGLMFTSLHNLEDQAVFDANKTFTVFTENNRFTYELAAAVWYNDDYIPYYYDTTTDDGMLAFWNSVVTETDTVNEPSHIREGTVIAPGDKLCVLSTCCRKNGSIVQGRRYLVIGKLIETAVCQ